MKPPTGWRGPTSSVSETCRHHGQPHTPVGKHGVLDAGNCGDRAASVTQQRRVSGRSPRDGRPDDTWPMRGRHLRQNTAQRSGPEIAGNGTWPCGAVATRLPLTEKIAGSNPAKVTHVARNRPTSSGRPRSTTGMQTPPQKQRARGSKVPWRRCVGRHRSGPSPSEHRGGQAGDAFTGSSSGSPPNLPRSFRGPGHRPFTSAAPVRIRFGVQRLRLTPSDTPGNPTAAHSAGGGNPKHRRSLGSTRSTGSYPLRVGGCGRAAADAVGHNRATRVRRLGPKTATARGRAVR
jgi:hypothetical protein